MSSAQRLRHGLLPWAGLIAGTASAGLAHQIGSDSVFNDCAAAATLPLLLVGLFAIAATAAAGLASWRVARNPGEGPSRRLIALVSAGTALLFILVIFLPMLAALVLPPCFQ